MDINRINRVKNTNYSYDSYEKTHDSTVKNSSKDKIKAPASESDIYLADGGSSNSEIGKTYSRDDFTIDKLKMEAEKQTQQLRDIVEKLIMQQGEKFQESGMIEIDSETRLKAQEDISENGYWGVDQTSKRIFDFAIALSGGDPSKAQSMKEAFIKGFEKAKEAWGGTLPEISNKTYEATIKMFDEWIGENSQA